MEFVSVAGSLSLVALKLFVLGRELLDLLPHIRSGLFSLLFVGFGIRDDLELGDVSVFVTLLTRLLIGFGGELLECL